MEFLRFGSSIPGSYWGCCCFDIIQKFDVDPNQKASIQLVSGDGGQPLGNNFLGKTYKEIFEYRLRIGTFSMSDMPNHGFLAVLTHNQLKTPNGEAWLKILKENGFEFIRRVSNSVGGGKTLRTKFSASNDYQSNYLFGLFRNIGDKYNTNMFQPPEGWDDLPSPEGFLEANSFITPNQAARVQKSQEKAHTERWNSIGPCRFYTEEEIEMADVPVWYAGQRSRFPQQTKKGRDEIKKYDNKYDNQSKITTKSYEALSAV